MTVRELRAEAKRLGLRGYSRLRKASLLVMVERARGRRTVQDVRTVAGLREECRARGLRGWSRLRKAELIELLANTRSLAAREPSAEEVVLQEIATLTTLEDARSLARIMRAGNSGQPAPMADVQRWRAIEARAVRQLRDGSTCDHQRRQWADRHIAVANGV